MKRILKVLVIVFVLSITAGCGVQDLIGIKKGDDGVSNNKIGFGLKKTVNVKIGQNITFKDNFNIAFLSNEFSEKVVPTNPTGYYTYFHPRDKEKNKFIVLKTEIKNLGEEKLDGEKLPKAKLIYDKKYKYQSQLVTEEEDGSNLKSYSWYMDIEPLKTKKIWYLIEVPKEVETNTKASIIMEYEFNNKIYDLKLR